MRGQSFISMLVLGLFGLGAPPVLGQILGAAVPDAGPGGLESFGLGGLAVALAIWAVRESYQKRLEDRQANTDQVRQLDELRLEESRQYSESISRIYRAKAEADERMFSMHERMVAANERIIEKQNEFIRLALAREQAAAAQEPPQKGAHA